MNTDFPINQCTYVLVYIYMYVHKDVAKYFHNYVYIYLCNTKPNELDFLQ